MRIRCLFYVIDYMGQAVNNFIDIDLNYMFTGPHKIIGDWYAKQGLLFEHYWTGPLMFFKFNDVYSRFMTY